MLEAKATNYEGKIVSLKLITDNNQILEAVGFYVGETPQVLRLKNLQAIVPQMVKNPTTGKNETQVGFMNFHLSGEPGEIVELYKSSVMSMTLAKSEVTVELDKILKV